MVGPMEIARRARGRVTGRLESVPILALNVHTACNCRCVMCDIWKANSEKREITAHDLRRHAGAIQALHVQRVMLTGGEPLLHRNLWALCGHLQSLGIRITLVTTGLLIEHHAADIAAVIDTVVVSLDGPAGIHDAIRGVKGGFDRIVRGVSTLQSNEPVPTLIARSVVQERNAHVIDATIAAARQMGFDEISFLAADVSSTAFNRPEPWSVNRAAEIALSRQGRQSLAAAIDRCRQSHRELLSGGFVAGGAASLDRIAQYYDALAGEAQMPAGRCNAPWVSAVLEPNDVVRPCFFQPAYGSAAAGFERAINGEQAVAFRRGLDVASNETCRRCVCSLRLPVTARV